MKINSKIINALKKSSVVAIFVHINPDGDCLGSASALCEALQLLNKKVDIYCDDLISENYAFIKHINKVNSAKYSNYDLAIALDSSEIHRIGKYSELFKKIKNTIKIDHHQTREDYGNINVVEPVSSTCLILYYYITELLGELNDDIACSLYAGIACDTGSFLHSNTTYLEHEVAGKLLKYNFDLENLNYNLFKKTTLNQIKLFMIAYANLKFYSDNKIAVITISKKDFDITKTKKSDAGGIVNIAVNIEGVRVGIALCEEKKGLCSCSFRSNSSVDVSKIAEQFGGGGHKKSSGCNIFGHINTVTKKVVDACNLQINNKEK